MAKFSKFKKGLSSKGVAAKSEPRRQVGSKKISAYKHEKLLEYIFDRLAPHVSERDSKVALYNKITEGLAAKTKSEGFNREKVKAYAKGQTNVQGEVRYPKTLGIIGDTTVNVVNVLFPARQMYGSVELTPAKQKVTSAVVSELNKNAKAFKHYLNYYKVIHDSLAFNLGIAECRWRKIHGYLGQSSKNRHNLSQTTNRSTIKEGGEISRCDIYNTILDYNVATETYAADAEFYARVYRKSDFDIRLMASRSEITLTRELINALRSVTIVKNKIELKTNGSSWYNYAGAALGCDSTKGRGLYRGKPDFRTDLEFIMTAKAKDGCADRYSLKNDMNLGNPTEDSNDRPNAVNEYLEVVIRLNPSVFGLEASKTEVVGNQEVSPDMEIWRFGILNGDHIVAAEPYGLSHGLLPISVTRPRSELSDINGLSLAELMMPFQEASSSLMNMFLTQVRSDKNKGLTFYDKKTVDIDSMFDPSSGTIGVNLDGVNGQRKSIRDVVFNVPGHQVNGSTLTADQMLDAKMQDIFASQSVDELANLNRPVTHQSRTLSALQNLPIFVLSRVIHEELVEPLTYMLTRDMIKFGATIEFTDDNGQEQSIDTASLADIDLSLAVSDGLRGIDTVALAEKVSQLIQWLLQSPESSREYDMSKLMSYQLMLEGASVDFNNFKHRDPFDALPPEQKQMAMQLLQAAAQQEQQEGNT